MCKRCLLCCYVLSCRPMYLLLRMLSVQQLTLCKQWGHPFAICSQRLVRKVLLLLQLLLHSHNTSIIILVVLIVVYTLIHRVDWFANCQYLLVIRHSRVGTMTFRSNHWFVLCSYKVHIPWLPNFQLLLIKKVPYLMSTENSWRQQQHCRYNLSLYLLCYFSSFIFGELRGTKNKKSHAILNCNQCLWSKIMWYGYKWFHKILCRVTWWNIPWYDTSSINKSSKNNIVAKSDNILERPCPAQASFALLFTFLYLPQ